MIFDLSRIKKKYHDDTSGYVYLICDPVTDYFKIGVTKGDLRKRIKKLQTGNGAELFLENYYETRYPFRLETMLHNKFINKNVLNEWFLLSFDDIKNFKETCIQLDNRIELLKTNYYFAKNLK